MPRSDSAGPGALDGSRLPRADRPDPKRPDSLAVAHAGGRRADQAREPEAPTFRMAARHWLVPRRAAGGLRATVAGGDGAPPSRAHAPRPLSRGDGRRQRRRRRAALRERIGTQRALSRARARRGVRPRADGTLRFHRLPPPSDADVARLVATIARRVGRLLVRRGLVDDTDSIDQLTAESLALAGLVSAGVQGRIALGLYRRGVTASTCMAPSRSGARIGIDSSSSAAISCARPSRRSGSRCGLTARSS